MKVTPRLSQIQQKLSLTAFTFWIAARLLSHRKPMRGCVTAVSFLLSSQLWHTASLISDDILVSIWSAHRLNPLNYQKSSSALNHRYSLLYGCFLPPSSPDTTESDDLLLYEFGHSVFETSLCSACSRHSSICYTRYQGLNCRLVCICSAAMHSTVFNIKCPH